MIDMALPAKMYSKASIMLMVFLLSSVFAIENSAAILFFEPLLPVDREQTTKQCLCQKDKIVGQMI